MAKKKSSSKSTETRVSFEGSLADLELVVSDLEQGELSLDESLARYEAGVQHLRDCYAALQKAESQIRLLVDIDDAGNARLNKFASGSAEELASDVDDQDDFSDEDPNETTLF